MAITRAAKEAQVVELSEIFAGAQLTVLTSYSHLSVARSQDLRKQLREQDGGFRVVKNAMLIRAVSQTFSGIDISHVEGPVAIAYSNSDPVAPAKTVVEYGKEHGVLEPIMAIDDSGNLYEAEDIKRLAELPSREQLHAQLVGTLAAPMRGLVTVMQGNVRGLVTVLDGIAKQN